MKHVFICGLHRSGTTVLAREIGKLESCTSFENTGASMDEGQWLQDVYPTDAAYGGAGRFGLAPRAHLTERSPLLTPVNIAQLHDCWEPHWTRGAIRVEKSPPNLIMTRFLQAAFENAYFIVIKRHPVAVSLATQKWCEAPIHKLFDHWLRCHEIFDDDKARLRHVYELRYEEYVQDPGKCIAEIATFIGTSQPTRPIERAGDAFNEPYFRRWEQMLQRSPYRQYYRCVAALYETAFASHGYSAKELSGKRWFCLGLGHTTTHFAGLALCLGADIAAFSRDKWAALERKAARLIAQSSFGRTHGS